MTIVEYFDPYNVEHLNAYQHLHEYGTWPSDFVGKREVPYYWDRFIDNKIIDAWIKEKLNKEL
jgi:hypothetical protein